MKGVRLLAVLLLIGTAGFAQQVSLQEVRSLYQKAPDNEKACRELTKLLEPYNQTNNPVLLAYKGSAEILMAKHKFNPFAKLKYFNRGKKMLQKAIEADSANAELRFLRFAAQSNAPSFLGYDEDMQADKTFLLQAIPQLADTALKNYLISALQTTEIGQALKKITTINRLLL